MALLWRLRKHADYQKAYARSRKGSTRQISYFVALREPAQTLPGAESPLGVAEERRGSMVTGPRVGLTVPKVVGKAHERNRIKRRLRAIVRAEVGRLRGDVDVILHPRRSTMEAEFGALRSEVVEIFGRVERMLPGGSASGPIGGRPPVRGIGSRGKGRPTPRRGTA